MTRDEQIDVLKGLLARVRAGAMARGIELPKDHAREPSEVTFSTRAPRESSASLPIASHEEPAPEPLVPAPSTRPAEARNGGLTAFAETGTGTHAPLALVGEPPPDREGLASQLAAAALAPPPGLVDDDDDDNEQLPVTAVSISFENQAAELRAPQAPPLQPPPSRLPFEAAFEDEITSAGDPAEIEAAVLESAQSSRRIPTPPPTPPPSTRVPTGGPPKRAPSVPPAPPTRVVDPIPPAPPTRVVTPVPPAAPTRVASPTASPQRMSSLPAVPLTLDDLDLDGLGTPDAAVSVPPPRAASQVPPRLSQPPGPSSLSQPPVMAVPPPAPARIVAPPPPAPYLPTPPPPAPYVPTPPPPAPPAPYVPTPPPAPPASYVPTPPPPRVLTPPPPRIPTPPPYVAAPPPPQLPTPTAPAYVVTPPPPALVAAPEEIELDDDQIESAREPLMPDPTATLPGSSAPHLASGFDDRGSSPEIDASPASQRQMRVEDRPLDDVLEGVAEPPPESGEVESQRYTKVAEEIEQTTEVRALASVDVVDRPPVEVDNVAVATWSGRLASSERPSFGEILDRALDL